MVGEVNIELPEQRIPLRTQQRSPAPRPALQGIADPAAGHPGLDQVQQQRRQSARERSHPRSQQQQRCPVEGLQLGEATATPEPDLSPSTPAHQLPWPGPGPGFEQQQARRVLPGEGLPGLTAPLGLVPTPEGLQSQGRQIRPAMVAVVDPAAPQTRQRMGRPLREMLQRKACIRGHPAMGDGPRGTCAFLGSCASIAMTAFQAMALQLGDTVPNFTQDSQLGPINLYDFAGDSWVVLFSHPADYTPVCTTELGEVAKLRPEWEKRNVKTLALSVDRAESHKGWINDINDTQSTTVDYPILADEDRSVSDLYGMVHPKSLNNLTVRSVFIIDPQKKLRLQITYPASTGRNFDEILRVIDSLQLTDHHQVATPVNWKDGDDCVVVPSIPTEEARSRFPKGVTEVRPYLRLTPQPNR